MWGLRRSDQAFTQGMPQFCRRHSALAYATLELTQETEGVVLVTLRLEGTSLARLAKP